ncbi:carbohydrate kinase [Blastococcus sp. MG754426]|uniref:PfkB family carbohydrate kinase n=1 Tax=unclassified Blastococcus TaxID=2619396 RepID=UPI001EF0D66D|nr:MULTISPECIES: PfkB family carbohydrate kinase [unclassified Blastococcus]MCF6507094.1 carbohydrate kinase [Blastococcus sp. MG754426]MCF6511778.1 carbohydrate kinase [Blastococcus sp. MG754427]
MAAVVVLGQVGRDLVLRLPAVPEAGGSAPASDRRELLGGKGANQAVALAQLGVPVALVGAVGDDAAGRDVLAQAAADGIDVSGVVPRPGAATALLLDLVEDGGRRRLVEHVPPAVLLTPADVAAAGGVLAGCEVLSLQLQQPGAAVRAALGLAPPTALVVADGAPEDAPTREAVLGRADVVRADAAEAELLVGHRLSGPDDARDAAARLLAAGPRLVALATGEQGDLVAWRAGPAPGVAAGVGEADPAWADGEVLVPRLGGTPVDPTGAGDAWVAALVTALRGRRGPDEAAWLGAAAAASTVAHAGGRPALDPAVLAEVVARERDGGGSRLSSGRG